MLVWFIPSRMSASFIEEVTGIQSSRWRIRANRSPIQLDFKGFMCSYSLMQRRWSRARKELKSFMVQSGTRLLIHLETFTKKMTWRLVTKDWFPQREAWMSPLTVCGLWSLCSHQRLQRGARRSSSAEVPHTWPELHRGRRSWTPFIQLCFVLSLSSVRPRDDGNLWMLDE